MKHFAEKLLSAVKRSGAPACVGLDPHIDRIPRAIIEQSKAAFADPADVLIEAVAAFSMSLLDILRETGITIIKPQAAFYEALGSGGMAVYEAICERARVLDMVVIADVKRGDIGSTSDAYAAAWLGGTEFQGMRAAPVPCDALTVNPYLGSDGLLPFYKAAAATGRGVFTLLKTSNPSSGELQDLKLADGTPVYIAMAKRIKELSAAYPLAAGYSHIGAVVGATYPEVARELRELLPNTIFLVPGYGAQGATVKDLSVSFKADGTGAIVNSSRGVIHCYKPEDTDWASKVASAARAFIQDLRSLPVP